MTPGKAAWSWARLRPASGAAIAPSSSERLVSECTVVLPVNKLRPSQSLIRSGPDSISNVVCVAEKTAGLAAQTARQQAEFGDP